MAGKAKQDEATRFLPCLPGAVNLVLLLVALGSAALICMARPHKATATGQNRTQQQDRQAIAVLEPGLSSLFRTQLPEGNYHFTGSQALFRDYPLIATFSLQVEREIIDTAFLSRARASTSKYFKYLLLEHDTDGDFLVETPVPFSGAATGASQSSGPLLEDPGFNALLAIDMLSLSQMCIQLKQPVEGLFWREESKLIAQRVIDENFDIESKFFFPFNNPEQKIERFFYATSLVPAYFNDLLGNNLTGAMIKHYLLKPQYVRPESPYDYLSLGERSGQARTIAAQRLLKTVLLLEILNRNGFYGAEEKHREQLEHTLSSREDYQKLLSASPYTAALARMIASGSYRGFFPAHNALDLFIALVHNKRALHDPEIVRLETSLETVKNALGSLASIVPREKAGSHSGIDAATLSSSIRNVYFAASKVRSQLKEQSVHSPWKDRTILGFDLPNAMPGLLDDVVAVLKLAENALFDQLSQAQGLSIACILLNERRVPGEKLEIKTTVRATEQPVKIKSAVLTFPPYRETLIQTSSPVIIHPGDTTMTFTSSFPFKADREIGVNLVKMAVSVECEAGEKLQTNFLKAVYMEKPLEFALSFPKGQMLKNWPLPVDITLTKNAPYSIKVSTSYYSPSGLRVKGDRDAVLIMAAGRDAATIRLNIFPPQPCRPGSFPFAVKVFANGKDMGLATSKFFKHYQWIFVGPFGRPQDGLDRTFPPEKRINLLERFRAGNETIIWRELPIQAYGYNGEIILDRMLPAGGIGYLHTVIKSSTVKYCSVFLSSTAPAVLFINGEKVMASGRSQTLEHAQVRIRRGLNDILIKTARRAAPRIFFMLGDDGDLTSDEFNNNLWELVEGYQEFHRRTVESVMEPGETQRLVTLSYVDTEAHSVSVIGSFNGWSPENSTMRKISTARWEITLHLTPGKYTYRFLINNQRHVLDPKCLYQESDGYGGKNSVLFIE